MLADADQAAEAAPVVQGRPLLATKLFIPRPRRTLVARPSLLQVLGAGLSSKLTLISAPAGFGKTTLLAAWAGQTELPVAWLSLDAADNDPARFLTYLTGALQTVNAALGEELAAGLENLQPLRLESLLTGLVNDLMQQNTAMALVLDDYHLIEEAFVHNAVHFLIEHSPDYFHLIISTREDPPWPLARLRAGGQLCEIRGRDLRFTRAETAEFCTGVMGLQVSQAEIDALEKHIEGWAAGLQLAALSMQGQGESTFATGDFSGADRYILDYLLEEVLSQQPSPVQRFLMETAVLDRFCAPLCDAILSDETAAKSAGWSAQAMLESLELANLFITPLDGQRRWYRYHHLFGGLLRARLQRESPAEVAGLHRRAAGWFARQGYVEEAIAHALAADDVDLAARLIEKEGLDLVSRHKMVSLARWLESLPQEVVDDRPWLCIFMAYTRHWLGDRHFALGANLDRAERALRAAPPASAEETKRLRGYIASLRAQDALSAGDLPAIIEQANLALSLLPPGDMMGTETGVSLGGAYWIQGDARASERAFAAGRDTARRCNKLLMAVPTATYSGWQQMKQGRLQEAQASFAEALSWATLANGRIVPVGGFPMLRLSDLQYEWNDLETALETAREGADLCLRLSQADVVVDAHATLGLRLWAAGDWDGAWESVRRGEEAARNRRPDLFLRTRLDACRVRLWLDAGHLDAARAWLAVDGPDPAGTLSFHHDLHHLLAVRIMLAGGKPQEALHLALRVATAAADAFWVHEQIQALILASLAAQELGRTKTAVEHMTAALQLAEPSKYIRSFVDEGPVVRGLLQQTAAASDLLEAYRQMLLAAAESAAKPVATTEAQRLIEPLSAREIEILELVAGGLTNQQIATRLVLSLATVKWHASNIYGKLNVRSRSQAAARARELGILS